MCVCAALLYLQLRIVKDEGTGLGKQAEVYNKSAKGGVAASLRQIRVNLVHRTGL